VSNQVLGAVVLILACFLLYQAVIRSGPTDHPDDRMGRL